MLVLETPLPIPAFEMNQIPRGLDETNVAKVGLLPMSSFHEHTR